MGAGGSSADAARDKEPCHLLADQVLAAKQHVAALVDRQQLRPGDRSAAWTAFWKADRPSSLALMISVGTPISSSG